MIFIYFSLSASVIYIAELFRETLREQIREEMLDTWIDMCEVLLQVCKVRVEISMI